MKTQTIWQGGFAFLLGTLLTIGFAPFSLFPAAILSLSLLLMLWIYATPGQAFRLGWLFGVGFWGTSIYWIYISIHTFGNGSVLFSGLITGLFIALLALYPALSGYLLNRYFNNTNLPKLICAFPAIWLLLEWIRSWIFSGFPWLLIGYTQINSPLRGYAPIFSVYGVSLLTLISSALIVAIIINWKEKSRNSLLLVLALMWIMGAVLNTQTWTQAVGEPMKVSLVQGNIPQEQKWSSENVQNTLDRYQSLTVPHWNSQIIVWPESAIPIAFQSAIAYLDALTRDANKHHATIITGIPIKSGIGDSYYNGVVALGNGVGIYTKRRLVPFGEFIPMRSVLGQFLDFLNVPMSDFISSDTFISKPLIANGMNIATYVCYEIAFPEQVLSKDSNINALLTVSNDAWFGRSIAQAQHLEMAQMRALEMGRPVLFVANDGITAVINSFGKIQSQAPAHETYVLTDTVQMTSGKTPWQYIGLDPVLAISLLFLYIARRKKNQRIFNLQLPEPDLSWQKN